MGGCPYTAISELDDWFHRHVQLRERRAADLPVLAAVLRQVHEVGGYPKRWPIDPERWVAGKAAYGAWVAELAGELCGHVALNEVRDQACQLAWLGATGRGVDELAEVTRLFVGPNAGGMGIGHRLLDRAVHAAHARGAWPVLEVVSDGRAAAGRLYLAGGWQLVSRAPWFPGDGRELAVNCWVGPPPAE